MNRRPFPETTICTRYYSERAFKVSISSAKDQNVGLEQKLVGFSFELEEKKKAQMMQKTNGLNIVGCYMLRPSTHPVVACCCTKSETGQTFEPTAPDISFVP